jgi:hypothetical protein
MTTTTSTTVPATTLDETVWVRVVQLAAAVLIPALLVFAVAGTFFTTITEGQFRYAADYWYTSTGVPLSLAGIAITFALHRLQRGADGRLGSVGTALTIVAMAEICVQIVASIASGSEVRWGPSYPVAVLAIFIGLALLATGSWGSGLLPRWLLAVLPVAWVVGAFAAVGLTPLLLVAYTVALVATLTRRAR